MNTREIATSYRLASWTQVMRERSESGQSVRAYCRDAGIHENVYYYWQRKLREAACGQMSAQADTQETGLTVSGFTEVSVDVAEPRQQLQGSGHAGQIIAEYGGLHIVADSTYPADKLAALLRELTRA